MIAIWTDVDGILSADPNETSSAFVLPQLTYQEALDLCRSGAKVLHADAIGPAVVGHWVAPGTRNISDVDEFVKVEGRQRSPAYVAQVTRVWRDAIDALRLRRGDEALAVIKSTEVMIARESKR